jgi:hypothetical protein
MKMSVLVMKKLICLFMMICAQYFSCVTSCSIFVRSWNLHVTNGIVPQRNEILRMHLGRSQRNTDEGMRADPFGEVRRKGGVLRVRDVRMDQGGGISDGFGFRWGATFSKNKGERVWLGTSVAGGGHRAGSCELRKGRGGPRVLSLHG